MIHTNELFSLDETLAKEYLEQFEYPWDALCGIKDCILDLISTLDRNEYEEIKENVFVHKSATIFESAYLQGPCIIGPNSTVRHGAFIRGSVLVGESCVVGNSVELKNVILMNHVAVPHFNYVGDSILGAHSHMGAGAITSNVKNDKHPVVVHEKDHQIDTGLKKFGAMLGDGVEVGCNSVLNPGTIIGKNTSVYPLSFVRGVIDENCIVKQNGTIVKKEVR